MSKDTIIHDDGSMPWMLDESYMPLAFENLAKAEKYFASFYRENPEMRVYEKENYWPAADSFMSGFRPYRVDSDGILIIPVKGTLTYKLDVCFFDEVTGYDYIRAAIERGLADKSVNGIILDVDSGGGTAFGAFEIGDFIHSVRDVKPMIALVGGACNSSAYCVASAARGLYLSTGAIAGSIGIRLRRLDITAALKEQGVKVTYLYAGPRKADGMIDKEMSNDEKSAEMTIIDELYDIFCLQVARNRGISKQSVIDTESGIFTAAGCVKLGLANEGHDFDAIIADFVKVCTEKKE